MAKGITWRGPALGLALCGLVGCLEGPGEYGGDPMPVGAICTGHLLISGSFELGAPQPADVFGCWPVGTWTFTATVESHNCATAPALETQYQFKVERDEEGNETHTYLNDPTYEKVRMKVSSGGGGLCQGTFEVATPDGTHIATFKPDLHADMTIQGQGDYDVYPDDQW